MARMGVFDRYAPFVQDFIYAHEWENLRGVQVAAGEAIFDTDDHVLLCASTASGKTEAAFFPILTEFWENPPASVGALYIGPTKALINDQFYRLTDLCEEAGINVWHWHGDVSASHKARLVKRPSGILQITPESLEALLMRRHAVVSKLFCDLRYVVVDEIHSLLRQDRGGQCLCLIERLARIAGVQPRRIGLSATIGDPEAVAYIERRGFTLDEARAFGWGYDPAKHGLVLPYGPDAPYYYTRRDLRKGTGEDGKYYKPPVDAVGPSPLCGMSAIDRARVVFVVEGLMDAYALMACGVEAIALNGTSNAKRTAEAVVEAGYGGCVVLLLDNDEAGEKAFREMDAILEAGGVVHRKAAEFPANDAGDYLASDRDGLSRYLSGEEWEATRYLEEGAEERYSAALASMRVVRPYDAMTRIWGLEDCEEPIPTGFSGIDKALDGGLRSGLYVLGAVSSLGKTTLAVQIADNIARSGRPVLFVTIEQSAREIVSKSLSRLMRAHGVAMPTRAINSREARTTWNGAATEAFEAACMDYCEVSLHLNILEGVKQPTVFDVQAVAETIARHEGTPPVVFIDYLQLLAPQGERDTEKQATDKNVMSLRQMARDLKTPLFIISSLNRSSYSGSISLDSFKESGAIEYGADVLLGLQPYGMADRMEDEAESKARREAGKIMREAKASNERQCELMVLKQRDGGTPRDGIPLTFIPVSSAFFDNINTSAADLPRKARAVI